MSDLVYLKTSSQIEQLAQLEFGLTKQAGMFDDLLGQLNGGVASAITDFVKTQFKGDAPGGYFTDFMSILAGGALWNIHPLLGVIYTIADQFDLDLSGIVKKIGDYLKPKLEKGLPISSEEVVNAAESAAGMSVTAFEKDLDELVKRAKMYRAAGFWDDADDYKNKFKNNSSILDKILGKESYILKAHGKGKAKKIILGLLIWVVKTVLKGAGLLMVGGFVASLLNHKKPSETSETLESTTENKTPTSTKLEPKQPSNTVEKKYWVVPLIGSIENTLSIWAKDFYPELNKITNLEQILESLPSFRDLVAYLRADPTKVGTKQLIMPNKFKDRKEVIDSFIDDLRSTTL